MYGLPGDVIELVAPERRHRLRPVETLRAEHVADRLVADVGALVQLREMPGRHAGAERPLAIVDDLLTGEQPQEVRLPGSVGTHDADALAEAHLRVERLHDAGDRQPARAERDLAGPSSRQAHPHLLVGGALRRRLPILEPLEPVLGGAGPRSPAVVVRRLPLHLLHHVAQSPVLLLVAAMPLVQPLEASLSRVGVRGEAAHMCPSRSPFQRHDPRRGTIEHRPIVRDEQDRPRVLADRGLEPLLPRHVERVVGFVQQQHVERRGEHDLEREPLALPSGQRDDRAIGALGEAAAERAMCAAVPQDLRAVPAGLLPRGQRGRVRELGVLVGVRGQPILRRSQPLRGLTDRLLAVGEQEVPHGDRTVCRSDELTHQSDAAVDVDRAGGGALLGGDQPQQRGLADAVRPDQAHVLAFGHAERHLLEEGPSARQCDGHVRQLDESHRCSIRSPFRAGCSFVGRPIASGAREGRRRGDTVAAVPRVRPGNRCVSPVRYGTNTHALFADPFTSPGSQHEACDRGVGREHGVRRARLRDAELALQSDPAHDGARVRSPAVDLIAARPRPSRCGRTHARRIARDHVGGGRLPADPPRSMEPAHLVEDGGAAGDRLPPAGADAPAAVLP